MAASNKKVAIIGSGLIGKSWAMLFTSVGYSVTLYDISKDLVDAALSDLETQLAKLEKEKSLKGSLTAAEQINLISGETELGSWAEGSSVRARMRS